MEWPRVTCLPLLLRRPSCFTALLLLLLSFILPTTISPTLVFGAVSADKPKATDKAKSEKLKKAKEKAKKDCEKECKDKQKTATPVITGGGDPPPPPPPFDYDKCVKDCCSEKYKALITEHSGGKWTFGNLDKNNPNYDEIIESIVDSLADALATDPGLAATPITWSVQNTQHIVSGFSVQAYTAPILNAQGVWTGGYTITYYNPNGSQGGWYWLPEGDTRSKPFLAQPADQSSPAQFDPDTFIYLTTHHELSHVRLYSVAYVNPQVLIDWTNIWSNSFANLGNLPQQQMYYIPNVSYEAAYSHSVWLGFAVAMSYYKMGWVYPDSVVWNYMASYSTYLQ